MESSAHTSTFLFTDIQSSSRLWEDHPDAMPRALAEHDAILQRAVTENGGRIFKSAGDSVCAVFATPLDAARAAVAAQQALFGTDWQTLGIARALTVRMGLQSGLAEERAGDYFGPVLNRVSRLMRAGHGGQILVADPAAAALDAQRPAGTRLRDLGERRLRDIPGVHRVYQIEIEGLPVDFPPLDTLDTVPHNLPATSETCIGRVGESTAIRDLLLDSPARLVSLLGPGGIGKTRLSLHVANQSIDQFPGGIWFVDLSRMHDAAHIPAEVAQAMDLRIDPGSDPITAIAARIGDTRALLVLDNCEQVVDGAARFVTASLPMSSGMHVLVTSRSPLNIRGEQRVEIGPLLIEDENRAGPAVQLFLERARQHRPGFELTESNRDAVFDICRRVDGIPLALELAAARVAVLSPDALRTRLSSRLSMLASGSRDLPERHKTLRTAIAWSYALLTEDERRAFRALAIFEDGWSLAAAQALLRLDEFATMECLRSLRDKSLIRLSETGDEPRFAMLGTIQDYGIEQLRETGDYEAACAAHSAFFVELSGQAAPYIAGSSQQQYWLGVLDREFANLRVAISRSLDAGDHETAIDLALNLWFYWSARGMMDEGQRWLAATLNGDIDPLLRARALRALGNLCVERGELPAAESLYRASLELSRAGDHELGIAQSLSFLGMVAGMQGRAGDEFVWQSDALERCRALGVTRGIAVSLVNLAVWNYGQERDAEALVLLDEVRSLYEELRDELSLAFCQIFRAQVLGAQGEFERAAGLLEDASAVFVQADVPDGLHFARLRHAFVEAQRGNWARATLLADEAVDGYRQRGDKSLLAEALETAALVGTHSDDPARGAEALGAASYLRGVTNSRSAPRFSRQIERAQDEIESTLGSAAFERHWEQGRQAELRANWRIIAPPGLLELIDALPATT